MQARILKIEQSYPLADEGDVQNYIVVQLPDGKIIRAEVDDEATTSVMQARGVGDFYPEGNGQQSQFTTAVENPAPSPPVPDVPSIPEQAGNDVIEQAFEDENTSGLIDWEKLSPDQLSPMMKNVFRQLGVAPALTADQINGLVTSIVEGMQSEDGDEAQPAGKVEPPKPSVQVQQGRIRQNIPPIRTVQKDEWGNPIVPRRADDSDPGEVVDDDMDEDGVGQL